MWNINWGNQLCILILPVFSELLLIMFFDIFLKRKEMRKAAKIVYTLFWGWQLYISIKNELPIYINIGITLLIIFITIQTIYKGKVWNKCVFVVSFLTIWMLMESICGYILMNYTTEYFSLQLVGSLSSKMLLLLIILVLKVLFSDKIIRELQINYSLMLMLLPMGSIYIIFTLFVLSSRISVVNNGSISLIASLILLGINFLIFSIYLRLAEDLHLRRSNIVYEKQLELCERHEQEREFYMLQIRDANHNMKNNLITILGYIKGEDYLQATKFIQNIVDIDGSSKKAARNTGNIVIDSLVDYWSAVALKMDIDFQSELNIPIQVPFNGAALCLILGNALENAVEAVRDVKGKKYIKIHIKYDKNNLIISVINTFNGYVKRGRDNRLKSIKLDEKNHGIGLESIYRAVEEYNGTVTIDISTEVFLLRVILYGRERNQRAHVELRNS